MNKKEFIKLVQDNIGIFHCISTCEYQERYDKYYTIIQIYWKNGKFEGTTVKELTGRATDKKNIEELNKYKKWLQNIEINNIQLR